MKAIYEVKDDTTGALIFKMPQFDRDLRMDDVFEYNGTAYKVESVLLKLTTYGPTSGNAIPGYNLPICEVKVSLVP